MTLPFTVGAQMLLVRRTRRVQRQAQMEMETRAWMRAEQTPEQKFKLAQMRVRRGRLSK